MIKIMQSKGFDECKAINPNDPIYLQYLVDNPTDISKYPQYAEFAPRNPPTTSASPTQASIIPGVWSVM